MSAQVIVVGIFVNRLRPNAWVLKLKNSKCIPLNYTGLYTPVMHGVEYTIQLTPEATIIDGKRVWDREVHSMFFPTLQFKEEWDPEFYIPKQSIKTEECIRWLKFDLDFHIQRIIPPIPAAQYAQQVKRGAEGLEKLVYVVGSVDPRQIKRFGASPELVLDALNIETLTNLSKRYRAVWLRNEHCASFLVESDAIQESFARLVEKGVIEYREVGGVIEFGLKWMVNLEKSLSPCEYIFKEDTPPPTIRDKRRKVKVCAGNPYLRLDHLVDRRQLPVSYSKMITWKGLPEFKAPEVKTFAQFVACIKHVNERLESINPATVLTFSELGDVGFDTEKRWTCVIDGKLSSVRICIHNPNMLIVDEREMDSKEALGKLECVSRLKWSQLPNYVKYKPSVVVAYFRFREEMEWSAWLDRFDASVIKILVGTFR